MLNNNNKKKRFNNKKNGVEDLPWSKRPPAHGPEVRAGWLWLQEGGKKGVGLSEDPA